jgi:hypothetical protein
VSALEPPGQTLDFEALTAEGAPDGIFTVSFAPELVAIPPAALVTRHEYTPESFAVTVLIDRLFVAMPEKCAPLRLPAAFCH